MRQACRARKEVAQKVKRQISPTLLMTLPEAQRPPSFQTKHSIASHTPPILTKNTPKMLEKLNPFSSSPSTTSEVVDLRIYPIKSCRGISVNKSYLTKRGLDLDRRWMFVDAETLKYEFNCCLSF
jgi:hypothetical protein